MGEAGAVEIGFWCPKCQNWTHCFYDTPALKEQRALLQKFKAKAGASAKDWQRWLRKKEQYRAAFDRVQGEMAGVRGS